MEFKDKESQKTSASSEPSGSCMATLGHFFAIPQGQMETAERLEKLEVEVIGQCAKCMLDKYGDLSLTTQNPCEKAKYDSMFL